MPAKGRYFLNEGEEDPSHDTLYEKYRLTSQHGPLLLTLLLVAITACAVLIVIAFSYGVSGGFPGVQVSALMLCTCEALGKSLSSLSLSFCICKVLWSIFRLEEDTVFILIFKSGVVLDVTLIWPNKLPSLFSTMDFDFTEGLCITAPTSSTVADIMHQSQNSLSRSRPGWGGGCVSESFL